MLPNRVSLLKDPHLRRLFAMVLLRKKMLGFALFATAITALTEPALAKLTGMLTDKALLQRESGSYIMMPLAFVGLFILRGITSFTSSYYLNRVSQDVLNELRASMFNRMLKWPSATFHATPSGVVISKFLNEATNALALVSEILLTSVRDGLIVIGLLAVLVYYNWTLTLVMLIVAPVIAISLRMLSRRLRTLNLQNQAMLGDMTRVVQEAHEGHRVVKIYGGYAYEAERFGDINAKLRGYAIRMQVAWSAATPITQVTGAIAVAIVMVIALWQIRETQVSPGEFVTFLTAALLLLPALRHLAGINGPIARLAAASSSVFEMVDTPEDEDPGRRELGRARGHVRFSDVTVTYPGASEAALSGFSLDVQPGEMIALVGPSGAGKTTVINLLPRFVRASAGDILIDDVPITELTLASLRQQMALVSQDVVLFDDTIAANIAYGGQRGLPMERIRAAAEAAYLLPFIAPILLLDEATSALDSESERYIQASLERLMQGRTTFVVAHRLSTIERAHRIVVLEQGRIVEIGDHESLLAAGGLYAHLHRIQFTQPASERAS
jgi:ATP-binding cassette, subfamily B, bacterial MsbA